MAATTADCTTLLSCADCLNSAGDKCAWVLKAVDNATSVCMRGADAPSGGGDDSVIRNLDNCPDEHNFSHFIMIACLVLVVVLILLVVLVFVIRKVRAYRAATSTSTGKSDKDKEAAEPMCDEKAEADGADGNKE